VENTNTMGCSARKTSKQTKRLCNSRDSGEIKKKTKEKKKEQFATTEDAF
jgi:hypothetical protein